MWRRDEMRCARTQARSIRSGWPRGVAVVRAAGASAPQHRHLPKTCRDSTVLLAPDSVYRTVAWSPTSRRRSSASTLCHPWRIRMDEGSARRTMPRSVTRESVRVDGSYWSILPRRLTVVEAGVAGCTAAVGTRGSIRPDAGGPWPNRTALDRTVHSSPGCLFMTGLSSSGTRTLSPISRVMPIGRRGICRGDLRHNALTAWPMHGITGDEPARTPHCG
jgi:hypothetical protein